MIVRNRGTAALLVLGIATLVVGAVVAHEGGEGKEANEAALKGSVAVHGEKGEALLGMAKVSLGDALAAALAKAPGKAWKAELEAEDGSLIYTVQIVTADKQWKEVNVDAGTGAVLAVEAGDADEFGRPEGKGREGDEQGEKGGKHEENDDED